MTLEQEVKQIVKNAKADLRAGKITPEQYRDIVRIPLKDLYLSRMNK